jgi:protein-disulfide isomerase
MPTTSSRSGVRSRPVEPATITEYINKYAVTVLLVVAAFVIGVLFTEVRYLKKGYSGAPSAGTGTGTAAAGAQTGPTIAMSDILDTIGVDSSDVLSCYQKGDFLDKIQAQQSGGTTAGVTGTPGNFIVVDGGKGELIAGALPLASMKSLIDDYLQDGTAPSTVDLPTLPPVSGDDYVRGPANARITIVEYSDFDCPFCQQFHMTMNEIMKAYPNDVRWVYRHFPLVQLHPNAENVARVSECVRNAGGAEKFWEFADEYFGAKAAGATVTI